MKNPLSRIVLTIASVTIAIANADEAVVIRDQITLTHAPSVPESNMDVWRAEWQGTEHRTYFMKWSPDLVNWQYLPTIDFGTGLHQQVCPFVQEKSFARLFYYDDPAINSVAEARSADYDHDGVSNRNELITYGMDPLQSSVVRFKKLTTSGSPSVSANPADYSVILGPVSKVNKRTSSGIEASGWFPDAHFPLITGGANAPGKNLSWWIDRKEGTRLDTSAASPGAVWLQPGPYHSGDYRGNWILTVYRPVDYDPSLNSSTVELFIYQDNNAEPPSPVTHVIDADYLVAFSHAEDYKISDGTEDNKSRTLYSFDNGLTWKKGPWTGAVPGLIDIFTDPVHPRLVSMEQNKFATTDSIATGTGWTSAAATFNTGNFAYVNSLFYNRYFGKWTAWSATWGGTPTVQMLVSDDFKTWKPAVEIPLSTPSPGGALMGDGNYPTLMGSLSHSQGAYDMECGQLAWLYNNSGGFTARAVHFIGQARENITWTNATGSSNMATLGNFKLTTGGTAFTGYVDERQSITFSDTIGGALNNDIPTSIRIRGLLFNAGTPSHTISGNAIQLEAFRYYDSDVAKYAVNGITNKSVNLQTINTPIDVRTAALFLFSRNGDLKLTGPIDMRGSGGIVVSGDYKTELLGSIRDTGYTDFTTGAPEFIASANPGKLVKQGLGGLVLGGANSFNGHTDIDAGWVRLDDSFALSDSVVNLNAAATLTVTGNTVLGGLTGAGNLPMGSYDLTLGNNHPIDCYSTQHQGSISGSGSLTKTGSSVQGLSSNNPFAGGIFLNGGILEFPGSSLALGSGAITFNGGLLRTTGATHLTNAIVISAPTATIDTNNNDLVLDGVISGGGQLITQGNGRLVLNGSNTYSGGTIIRGVVEISASGALGLGTFDLNGGSLKITADLDLGSQGMNVTSTLSSIDTGIYTLSLSGPILLNAPDKLLKRGSGIFNWSGDGSSLDGDLIIESGTLRYTRAGSPLSFSHGGITLKGSTLLIEPPGSGGAVEVNLAQASGRKFRLDGGGVLALNRGAHPGLVVNIGAAGNPEAILKGSTSTFYIDANNLGASPGVKVFAAGTADTLAGGIHSPALLVKSGGTYDFLRYDSVNGFSAFTGYQNRAAGFQQVTPSSPEISNITAPVTLSGDSNLTAVRLNGANSLNLGVHVLALNGIAGEAGVIMNGGGISNGTLDFGTNRGFIHSSASGSILTCKLSGSNGITFSGGPGSSVTINKSANDWSGGINVIGTTAIVIAGLGTSANGVVVDGQGVMRFPMNNTISRNFMVNAGGGGIDIPDTYTLYFANPLSGPGIFTKYGSGTLQLDGTNTLSGLIKVAEGKLAMNGRWSLHNSTSTFHVSNGACLINYLWRGDTAVTVSNNYVIQGSGVSNSGALFLNGGESVYGSITLEGDSLIKLNSGSTPITMAGSIAASGQNLEISATGTQSKISGPIGLGTGSMKISGAGGIGFSDVATWSGTTTIAADSILTLSGIITGTSGVSVLGKLNGSGEISTTGIVNIGSGGNVQGGDGTTPQMLTVRGDVAFDASAVISSKVKNAGASVSSGDSSGYGQLVVIGNVNINGKLKLDVDATYIPGINDNLFIMLRNGGGGTFAGIDLTDSSGTTLNIPAGQDAPITINGKAGKIRYNRHSSQALTSGSYDVVIDFK